ncbi:D-alanyl-D-alanine carboxypeptidase [Streptomyces sp. SAI-041]|uniref:D-alanyl-D-alanine carboxypeptidase n=1 Tax=Streptomyces sp. SAI-041 TaxID=2940548 RepID=UPI002476C1B3|nr:D-alanyl-D-alanine carboxypeptidase [Streptomyces sp. SAI-041]MDH6550635.1 D-alanyl-D-alanine carboxypeptidase (penicillin-binding protein 5/6) [Streptomyces sp. SAI-041]
MAGESPDRSKQRESSAEPTSGSASPVPEARSSARDPRLAVARESVSLGGVDTATKVFSVRDLPKDAEEADESPAGAGTDASATAGAKDADTAGSGTAESPDDADTAEDSADPDTAEGSGDSGTDAGSGDSGTAEAPDDSGTAKTADDSDTAGDSAETGTAEVPEDAAVTAKGSDDSGSGDSGAGDARLRDAVAAWVATGDKSGSQAGSGEAEAAEPSEDVETAEPAVKVGGKDAEPAAEADDPDTGESDTPGARGTARPAPTGPQPDDEPEDAPEDAPEDRVPDDADLADEPPVDEPPVDQPTAVFKAPRPPVDQPTTMLKLGKAPDKAPDAEPEAKPEPEKGPRPQPEAEAERTSKFVALKALDEPREARPRPDVTAAVPQVGPERTTQQPLPPKPPLDLLAELTNTPPPPPSPLRTLGRRVKIWTPLLVLLVVVFAIVQALRPLPEPTLSLTAEDSYTFKGSEAELPWPTQGQGWMDVNGVGTMGDFGKQTPVAIGSVAKAMTAYIVLKDHPLKSGDEGAKITVDALAEKEGGYNKDGESTLDTVKQGDVLTQKQAIAAIMIPSANNIARLLARWDAGSEKAFIAKMNATAKELGMKNTTYTDASGLKETTVSTAEDQVKLGNELVKIPALMEITSMGQWIDPSGQKWYNYNYLVPYNGAIGIKTGTTSAAGGNLLFAARKEVGGETVTLVGAILGQHKAPIIKTVNDVSRVAMLAAQDDLTSAKILKKGDVVGYVDDGLGGHTPVVLTKDVTAVGWAGYKVKLSFAADEVPHTAKAGTKVGTLTVGDGEGGAVRVPVTLQKDLSEPGLTDKLTRVG